ETATPPPATASPNPWHPRTSLPARQATSTPAARQHSERICFLLPFNTTQPQRTPAPSSPRHVHSPAARLHSKSHPPQPDAPQNISAAPGSASAPQPLRPPPIPCTEYIQSPPSCSPQ